MSQTILAQTVLSQADPDKMPQKWRPKKGGSKISVTLQGLAGESLSIEAAEDWTVADLLTSAGKEPYWLWQVVADTEVLSWDSELKAAVKEGSTLTICYVQGEALLTTEAGEEGKMRITSLQTGECLLRFQASDWCCFYSVVVSEDHRRVLTACSDGCARIWSLISGKELQVFQRHDAAIGDAQFSPDESMILTAGHEGCVKLWSIELCQVLQSWQVKDGDVCEDGLLGLEALFTPDQKHVIIVTYPVSSNDPRRMQIMFQDIQDGTCVRVIEEPGEFAVLGSKLSSDGSSLLLTGFQSVQFWNLEKGTFQSFTAGTASFAEKDRIILVGPVLQKFCLKTGDCLQSVDLDGCKDLKMKTAVSDDGCVAILHPPPFQKPQKFALVHVKTGETVWINVPAFEGSDSLILYHATNDLFSPKGKYIFTRDSSDQAWLFSTETREALNNVWIPNVQMAAFI